MRLREKLHNSLRLVSFAVDTQTYFTNTSDKLHFFSYPDRNDVAVVVMTSLVINFNIKRAVIISHNCSLKIIIMFECSYF
jgi:hypothetical protein